MVFKAQIGAIHGFVAVATEGANTGLLTATIFLLLACCCLLAVAVLHLADSRAIGKRLCRQKLHYEKKKQLLPDDCFYMHYSTPAWII